MLRSFWSSAWQRLIQWYDDRDAALAPTPPSAPAAPVPSPREVPAHLLDELVDSLPPCFRSVGEAVRDRAAVTLHEEDSIVAAHDPSRAPQYYALELWPGTGADSIEAYAARQGLEIPPFYAEILERVSGATIGDVHLYGIPKSMLGDPPLLDRRRRQPLDLATANRYWRHEYPGANEQCLIGSFVWGQKDTAGLFCDGPDRITARISSGGVAREFGSIEEVLDHGLSTIKPAD